MHLEDQLHGHAKALRSLALALVGERHADDLLQDTMVQALQQRGGGMTSPRAWLATVMRFLASKLRRGERRCGERERAVARPDEVPPDAGLDAREAFHRLNAAVAALPEPYQTTIVLRYLRELSPGDVAAAMQVPLATVKTRLVRGLALLRERLDGEPRGRGGDWRGAMVGAFGLDRVTAAATAAGVVATGGIVMTATMKYVLGGVAAAAIGMAFWLGEFVPGDPVPLAADAGQRATVAAAALPADAQPAADAPQPARDEVRAAATASATDDRVTVRGRCVDENGAPLPGLALELRAETNETAVGRDVDREYGEWLVARGGRNWNDQQGATAADGTFEFSAERTPLQVTLSIAREDIEYATSLSWRRTNAIDLADIPVPCACALRIRVVDTAGRVVPTPHVHLRAVGPAGALVTRTGSPVAAGDGVANVRIVAGVYECGVTGSTIVRGERIDVPRLTPTWEHEAVVEAPTSTETIQGVVVDERGLPVADVEVVAYPAPFHSAGTDPLGRFTLQRRGQRGDSVELRCSRRGFEDVGQAVPAKWGASDVRLVLRDYANVAVHVVDDASGEPVTGFAVRVWPANEHSGYNPGVRRESREHAGGVAQVPGVARGDRVLVVEPHRWDLWRSDAVAFTASATRPTRVDVRLRRSADRELLVRRHDGRAVADARIELIDAAAAAPDAVGPGLQVTAIERWDPGKLSYARVLLRQTGTDARGRATLHGPADRDVVMRIVGEGIAPFVVGPFRLTDPEPLVATVPVGGRLVVRVTPPEFVQELLAKQDTDAKRGFRLRLGASQDAQQIPLASQPSARVRADGTFVLDGVPPGDWWIAHEELATTEVITRDGHESVAVLWPARAVAKVTLREGETTEATVDMSAWLRATLNGIARCNGEPVADAMIRVEVVSTNPDRPRPWRTLLHAGTDAEGRFTYRGRGGNVTVHVERTHDGDHGPNPNLVAATSSIELPAGAHLEHTFDVMPCAVRVRLLASDGAPIAGSTVMLTTPGDWPRHPLAPSDSDGRAIGETGEGTFTVQLGNARTPIGTVTVLRGATNAFELRVADGVR